MLLGLLIACAVVCSNVFQFENHGQVKIETKADKKKEEQKQRAEISAPTLSLPSTFIVHLNLETYCLFEISAEDRSDRSFVCDFSFHPQRYLLTLFRVIISPNAP